MRGAWAWCWSGLLDTPSYGGAGAVMAGDAAIDRAYVDAHLGELVLAIWTRAASDFRNRRIVSNRPRFAFMRGLFRGHGAGGATGATAASRHLPCHRLNTG